MSPNLTKSVRVLKKRLPKKGETTRVSIALVSDRTAPEYQVLGGFTTEITVPNSVAAANYSLVINGISHTVVGVTSATPADLGNSLIAKINQGTTGVIAWGLRASTVTNFYLTAFEPATITAAGSGLTAGSETSSTAIARGATSITLLKPLLSRIEAGNTLLYLDSDENYAKVKVSATAEIGATSLQIEKCGWAIPAGAIAEFPPYYEDITDHSVARTGTRQGTTTYNTGVNSDGAITGAEKSMAINSLYSDFNAALDNLFNAEANEVCVIRQLSATAGLLRGRRLIGFAVVTGLPDTAPVGNMTIAPALAFNGTVTEEAAVAMPL